MAMTSKARILTAIRHEEPDYVPISPRFWAFLKQYYGAFNPLFELEAARDFGYDPILVVGGAPSNYLMQPLEGNPPFGDLDQIKVELSITRNGEVTEIERRILTPAGPLTSAYMIGRPGTTYGINPNYHHHEYLVKTEADLEKLAYILTAPETIGLAEYFRVAEIFGENGLAFTRPGMGVDHFMVDSFGLSNLMLLYYDDRRFFMKALDFFQDYYRRLLKYNLEQGVKFIFESWYNFSLSCGWSPEMYRELIIPRIKANVDLVHDYDAYMLFYDDGKMLEILPDLVACGVDLVETLTPPPIGDVDLFRAKAIAHGKTCLKGNIDLVNVILMGTPKLVEAKVAEAMTACKDGGGFILSTSDSIRDGSPMENVRAFFAAGRKYGKYS